MNKKFWTTALVFGIPWTVCMIIFTAIMEGSLNLNTILSSIVGGIIASVFFAWVMQYTAGRLLEKINIETDNDETIIKEGGANHFKGMEGVGGKLVLTDKRLLFKSHRYNNQNHQESFDLEQIESVVATKNLLFWKNGLQLKMRDHGVQKFVVEEPGRWRDAINEQREMKLAMK
jgi:hypothetical protein